MKSLESKLDVLKGGLYLYRNSNIKIVDYNIEDGYVFISTDKSLLKIEEYKINDFIDSLLDVEDEIEPAPKQSNLIITGNSNVISDFAKNMMATINNSIDKIEKDKEYLEQSRAVNEQVQSGIALMKTIVSAARG